MARRGTSHVLVFSPQHELAGLVTRAQLLEFLQRRSELGYA
jgi:hypothetical protein